MYLDTMPYVLQTCPAIFLNVQKLQNVHVCYEHWGYCPIQDSENGKSFTAIRAMKIEFIELALLETLSRFLVKTPYEFAEFFQTKFRIQLDIIKKTRQLLKALLTSVCAIQFF
jgi:hypothetical protein